MARTKIEYTPDPDLLAHFPDISGNSVNGLGEEEKRRPSPFFWHPPEIQTHGELQKYIVENFRPAAHDKRSFRNPNSDRGPEPIPVADQKTEASSEEWTRRIKEFVLEDEGDLVGVAAVDPLYVVEGYEVDDPWLIMVGVAHDYESLKKAPPSEDNIDAYYDLHDQYNRAARTVARLANFIRGHGWNATAYQGPQGSAINMIPPAIAAGFGELGKHGSMINRRYGAGFRMAAVTTDLPLIADAPDIFGADEFCSNCRICEEACPPDAIYSEKQLVRGEWKWYVDFDKCIPYFGENFACGICIAECPWTRPGVADRLIVKMAKRAKRKAAE